LARQPAPSEFVQRRLSVLAAEDNPVIQSVLKFMLASWGYDPVMAADGFEAWHILQSGGAPRLAILDWMMPGIDGVEICRRLRASGKEPYTYVLLLTGRTDSADLVTGMDAGADDYLRKPFHAPELRTRLQAGARIVLLQEQLLGAREALREQAMQDALTGLLNHAYILDALSRELAQADRTGLPLAVLLADLDRFRQINETFGHQAGDEVLRESGRRLRSAIPAGTPIGRYGGEEFLVVLPGCGAAAANEHAGKLREAIRESAFTAGAASFPVSCSVGVACRELPHSSDARTLLREADEALFLAKRNAAPARQEGLVLETARL
jgi:two-component system cell cycle response regulator